jgi:hypothetical protein
MTFTVASDSFKDGDYLPSDFILSSDFGFGCAGRNRSPHLKWSGAPEHKRTASCQLPTIIVQWPRNASDGRDRRRQKINAKLISTWPGRG